jgi:ribonuclease VapC
LIVDSSALLAILLSEPEEGRLSAAILADPAPLVSAVTLLETSMVFEARVGPRGAIELDSFIAHFDIQPVPFTPEHAGIARDAFRRYGKGRHPAGLNFGDCMAYALAKASGEPLLFKGEDFSRTDIATAAY